MTNYLFWKRFAQGKLKTHVSSLKVRIPSPKEIFSWSERRLPNSTLVGKVDNAHTVEHDTLRPVSGGLFCERIFGPIATNVCACLRKKGWNENYCKICEVQFTKSRLRRYQMGHILLAAPVIHVWALQGGYLASLLGKKNFGIRSIAYGKVMSQSKLFESYTYGLTHTEDTGWRLSSQEVNGKNFHGLENDLKKTIDIPSLDFASSNYPLSLYPVAKGEGVRGDRLWRKHQRCIGVRGDRFWIAFDSPEANKRKQPKATRYTAKEGYKGTPKDNGLPTVIFGSQEMIKKSFPWQYSRTESSEGFSCFPKSILFPLFLWTKQHSLSTKGTQNLPESKIGKRETILSKNKTQGYPSLSQRSKNVAFGLPLAKEGVFAYESPLDRLWQKKESSSKTHRFTLWKAKVNGKGSRSESHEVIRTFSRALAEPKMQLILPPISTISLVHLIYPSTPLPFLALLPPTVSKRTPLPYGLAYTQDNKYLLLSTVFPPKMHRGNGSTGAKGMGYASKVHKSIGIGKETKILSYTKAKLLSHEGLGQYSKILSYKCTNEGVCLWRSHVQKFFGQDKKTKYFKLSSTTKKVISVLSFLYTYKKYPLLERQEEYVKKKKKRVYERGNVLPFHQFILYKPDCFKKISQFFDSLNKEQTPASELPLPFYSRLEGFAKSKSPTLFKSNGHKLRMRSMVKNFKSSRTCLLLPQYPCAPLSFTKATPKEHKGTGYGILSTKLSPTKGSASSLPLLPTVTDTPSPSAMHRRCKGYKVILSSISEGERSDRLGIAFGCVPQRGKEDAQSEANKRKQGLSTVISSSRKELTKGLKSSENLFGIKYTNEKQNNVKNTLLSKTDSQYLNPYSLTFISPRGIKDSRKEIKNYQKSYTIDSTYSVPSGQVLNTTPDLKAIRNFGVFNKFDVLYWRYTKTGDSLPTSTFKFLPFQKSPIFSLTCNLPPVSNNQVNTNVQKKLKNIEFTGPSVLSQTLKNLNLVLLDRLVNWKWKIGKTQLDSFLLQNKLTKKKRGLRNKLAKTKIILTRRKKLIQSFLNTKQLPEWMILSVLPVLPPALRPILELEPNNVVVSDLNTLYQTVIRRNDALMGLLTFRALEIDILNRQVSLQQAIEKLFDKGAGTKKRPVKSLSQGFHGKRGLFRLHLLGKRVDYSGRSVIVVGPRLKLHECGLPKEMALVLFLPFLIARLKRRKVANNTSQAKQLIIRKDKQIWNHLKALIYEHPVLLNRAPTLHRLGFQAFQPILVSGKAIILPALVCTGFNADFDGDQMAVHVPLSYAARAESWKLLYAKNNMLSPATGKPIIVLSQEMILGCYCSSLILNKTHFALRLGAVASTPLPLSPSEIKNKIARTPFAIGDHPVPPARTPFAIGDHPFTPSGYGVTGVQVHRGKGLRSKQVHRGKGLRSKQVRRQRRKDMGYGTGDESKIGRISGGSTISSNRRLTSLPMPYVQAKAIKSVRYFTTFQEVHMALNHNKIALQTAIWLRIPSFEDNQLLEEPLEIRLDAVGHSFRSYGQSQRHFSKNTKSQNQIKGISYIRTSAGRIQLNEIFYSSLRTSNSSLSWAV